MTHSLTALQAAFEQALEAYVAHLPKDGLHEPVHYILSLGGKRIRPVLVLLSAKSFGAGLEVAMPAALAVEIFHNFSLVHDDIMDAAPLRRGKPTVHHRWNGNTAILSGDAMLIEAYKQVARSHPKHLVSMLNLFNTTALEVCLGQQYDMDFELLDTVSEARYIEMIGLKTAVLLGCALKMGAIVADANPADAQYIYDFGKMAGIGFQIQDDYLDAFGNPETFGKQVGGDILANKKTLLSTYALQHAKGAARQELQALYKNEVSISAGEKVTRVQSIFQEIGADVHALQQAAYYFQAAEEALTALRLPDEAMEGLEMFLNSLRVREY